MEEYQKPTRIIFCVLGQLKLTEDTDGNKKLPNEHSFTKYNKLLGKNDPERFTGILTNEAPIKALLKMAHDSGSDATQIWYLCSNSCANRTIPATVAANWPAPLKLVQPSVSPNPYVGTICLQERTAHEAKKVHHRADHHEPA